MNIESVGYKELLVGIEDAGLTFHHLVIAYKLNVVIYFKALCAKQYYICN